MGGDRLAPTLERIRPPEHQAQRLYSLAIHDEHFSKDDAVIRLNFFGEGKLRPGDVVQIVALKHPTDGHVEARFNAVANLWRDAETTSKQNGNTFPTNSPQNHNADLGGSDHACASMRYVFVVKSHTKEIGSGSTTPELSISMKIATIFGFKHRSEVLVSKAEESDYAASHVEITFRDEYLSRGDMWRLIGAELAHHSVYKGQKILFMGTIKAQIRNVYVRGQKGRSAIFCNSTKPIFRSESARYVIFIQMSKEMWDFDTECTGEIMFNKVVDGFLPDLFSRWKQIGVRHLISIVLFTRVRNGGKPSSSREEQDQHDQTHKEAPTDSHQDLYRVVVSDKSSTDLADIIMRLRQEFKVFLRDVSIQKPKEGYHVSYSGSLSTPVDDLPSNVITGSPVPAMQGNLLEAINLASSQFSVDYIDRDLLRTGVSIAIVTPGSGLFEVDHSLLLTTTNNLTENGIGIDLICLSKMPLHSVPLFRYKVRDMRTLGLPAAQQIKHEPKCVSTRPQSFGYSSSKGVREGEKFPIDLQNKNLGPASNAEAFEFGIPHWVDISFWTWPSDRNHAHDLTMAETKWKAPSTVNRRKEFAPHVRMYDLQMMGVMEDAMSDIALPFLLSPMGASQKNALPSLESMSTASEATSPGSLMSPRQPGLRAYMKDRMKPKISSIVTADGSENEHQISFRAWMNEYDNQLFRVPSNGLRRRAAECTKENSSTASKSSNHKRRNNPPPRELSEQNDSSLGNSKEPTQIDQESSLIQQGSPKASAESSSLKRNASLRTAGYHGTTKLSRQISYGFKGFKGVAPKAVASTGVSSQHAETESPLQRRFTPDQIRLEDKPASRKSEALIDAYRKPKIQISSEGAIESPDLNDSGLSRPIPIRNATTFRVLGELETEAELSATNPHDEANAKHSNLSGIEPLPTPWLTIANPSNPRVMNDGLARRLGRWQHVFPRPLRASRLKWKSLCSPAAVPLTTEDVPSEGQLAAEYQQISYSLSIPQVESFSEVPQSPRWLVREMIAFRLSQGFQVVVSTKFVGSVDRPTPDPFNPCASDGDTAPQNQHTVTMIRGSVIHKISSPQPETICVQQFFQHRFQDNTKIPQPLYKPMIRTMLAEGYVSREIDLLVERQNFAWDQIDRYLAGHHKQKAGRFEEDLRFWRARFVLIPVDPPSNSRRSWSTPNEDNEEEIRIEGIRKLTQTWQRYRFIPRDERRFQGAARNRKDTNPLDILYQTRNPSEIVSAELDGVGDVEANGSPAQLLPESDLYQRIDLNMKSLAQTIQSDKGVRMTDRKWHWRLHYKCFIGFELTTWLLQNFRDVDTREEAVELGNELMNSGLFQHVEQRHNFRDGNYFYQISSNYRTRPESRGAWFSGRTSIPSTPASEDLDPEQELTRVPRSHDSSKDTKDKESVKEEESSSDKKQKLGVALSKSLILDVDHRKRSYRPELINLHYDRLHNPDNCYHIRIDWMNATPKLIEDAIISWASLVDRFGLRLVELPLAEASAISRIHPFRATYDVKLAVDPPSQQPQNYYDSTSFAARPSTEKYFYQTLILKKMNFVLDFEAATDFPADVDVIYSWGRPDYHFTQYIHRSGTVLAQINDDGDFLLLANRLYNNRSAAAQQDQLRPESNDTSQVSSHLRPNPFRSVAQRSSPSPDASPFSSPSLRPSRDLPLSLPGGFARAGQSTAFSDPEQITRELEAFCTNPAALQRFYAEALNKPSTPGPITPLLKEAKLDDVPTINLPTSLSARGNSPIAKPAKANLEGPVDSSAAPTSDSLEGPAD